ncbi:MAG: hypothetical protein WCO00_03375 [Rhodospirillaceae bacterium]
MRNALWAASLAVLAMLAPGLAGAGQMVEKSPLSGLVFDDKPTTLEDRGAFRDLMTKVAAESTRACGPLEIYGWEVADDDQQRVNTLVKFVKGAFKSGRYSVRPAKANIIWHADAEAFTADKDDRHLLVLLSLSPSATRERAVELVLLLCEAPVLAKE